MFDLLHWIESRPLRASLQDVFDDLDGEGETPEEKERWASSWTSTVFFFRLTRKREIVETVLNKQEREFEADIDSELSAVWEREEKKNWGEKMKGDRSHCFVPTSPNKFWASPSSNSWLLQPFGRFLIDCIKQFAYIRKQQLATQIEERLFVKRLKQMIGKYRDHFLEISKNILRDAKKRRPVPWKLLTTGSLLPIFEDPGSGKTNILIEELFRTPYRLYNLPIRWRIL